MDNWCDNPTQKLKTKMFYKVGPYDRYKWSYNPYKMAENR